MAHGSLRSFHLLPGMDSSEGSESSATKLFRTHWCAEDVSIVSLLTLLYDIGVFLGRSPKDTARSTAYDAYAYFRKKCGSPICRARWWARVKASKTTENSDTSFVYLYMSCINQHIHICYSVNVKYLINDANSVLPIQFLNTETTP